MKKRIQKLIEKTVKFWLPKSIPNHDIERMMVSFIGVQFASLVISLVATKFLFWLPTPKAATAMILYSLFNGISLILLKLNQFQTAQTVAVVNVAILLLLNSILLGREASFWIYTVVSIVGGHFFLSSTKKNRVISDIALLTSFILFLVADWFQWFSTEITPQNKVAVQRFGIFNILYALVILTSFVSYFHKKSMAYRGQLEHQALALKEQLALVSKILNSIKQAIFAIGPQKTVVPPVSQFTRNIFERSVEGEHIQDLLFVGKAQTEDCSKVESTLDLVFGEDELNWQILKNNLPGELEIKVGETNRKLKLSYNDMRADDGNLEKILLVAEDVTAMRELEEQFRDANEARERELQIVSQVYPKDPLQLDAFFKNTSRLLAEINAMKGDFRSIKERQSKIKRHIHTIKGNARAIGFTQFSNLAHDLESQMAQYNLEEVDSLSQVGPFLDVVGAKLQAVIDEYQKVTQKFVSFQHSATGKTLANDSVKIPVGNFNRFRCRIEEWIDDERPISAEDFLAQLKGLREVPVHELIQEKRLLVDEVAKSLGKEVEFVVSGDYVTVSEGIANSLYDVLTHALRNSLDHGIETPEERVRQNKNSKGRLEVRTLREKNEIIISIIDDGRGIDTERVVKKAQGLGLLTANDVESLNQQEQLQLIFHEGLSTKEQTTEYSGRGVGMDALKSSVEALGGCVNLTSQKQIGTELHLRFPIEATLKDSRPLAS